jgi:hypothetical protein
VRIGIVLGFAFLAVATSFDPASCQSAQVKAIRERLKTRPNDPTL